MLLNTLFQKIIIFLGISFNINFITENIIIKGEIKIVRSKLIISIIPITSISNI